MRLPRGRDRPRYSVTFVATRDEALDLPNAVDPGGFLTFGVTGAAVAPLWYVLVGRHLAREEALGA